MPEFLTRRYFREMVELERLMERLGPHAQVDVVRRVNFKDRQYPLYTVSLGSQDKSAPAIAYFGGVHGLEKIGSEVILSYMTSIVELLKWDETFQERLKKTRIIFMPIVNPVGIQHMSRSNGNGVDLMRNSPVVAEVEKGPIYRGHRISPKLPWYQGPAGAPMEEEAQAMCEVVEKELFPSKLSIAVDVHSGFGAQDRFWFPYAHTRKPFPHVAEVYGLKKMFDATYPHHFYAIEPVSRQYTIHGDLWDHLFIKHHNEYKSPNFFPFTLEMGSWMWLRKNPMQIFTKFGVFHPIKPHRMQRILRRHLTLFDFLHRSLLSASSWLTMTDQERNERSEKAMELWYED